MSHACVGMLCDGKCRHPAEEHAHAFMRDALVTAGVGHLSEHKRQAKMTISLNELA